MILLLLLLLLLLRDSRRRHDARSLLSLNDLQGSLLLQLHRRLLLLGSRGSGHNDLTRHRVRLRRLLLLVKDLVSLRLPLLLVALATVLVLLLASLVLPLKASFDDLWISLRL